MRTITEKDITAATAAFLQFIKGLNGINIRCQSLRPLVEQALDRGLTLDELFNVQNYKRCKNERDGQNVSAEDYISMMLERSVAVRKLKEENWTDSPDEMNLINKCMHEFYVTINSQGGRWNIESAQRNLEIAIKLFDLQSIMSSELIEKAMNEAGAQTMFQYISAIIRGKNIIPDTSLSQNQMEKTVMENYTTGQMEQVEDNEEQETKEKTVTDLLDEATNEVAKQQLKRNQEEQTEQVTLATECRGQDDRDIFGDGESREETERNGEKKEETDGKEQSGEENPAQETEEGNDGTESAGETQQESEKPAGQETDGISLEELEQMAHRYIETMVAKGVAEANARRENENREPEPGIPAEAAEEAAQPHEKQQEPEEQAEQEEAPAMQQMEFETPEQLASIAQTDGSEGESALFITEDPQDYKEKCIRSIIMNYTIADLMAMERNISGDGEEKFTIEGLIRALSEGKYDRTTETEQTRTIHENMNQDLTENWMQCMYRQGIDVTEDLMKVADPLCDTWDMRDQKTRTLQKLLKMITRDGHDDELMKAYKDLENLYRTDSSFASKKR